MLLTVTSPVPRWATSDKKAPYVTSPSDLALRRVHDRRRRATTARRCRCSRSGTSPTTPPSCSRSSTPTASRPRRASTAACIQAGYAGLRAGGIAHPKVLMGETAPIGYDSVKYLIREEPPKRCCTTSRRWRSCAGRCVSTPTTRNPAPAARCRRPATPTTPTRCPPGRSTGRPNATTSRSACSRG